MALGICRRIGNFLNASRELQRARRNPMVMELDADFLAYMKVIGTLLLAVVVVGGIVVGASWRERIRRREEAKANLSDLRTWDDESPNSLSHH